MEISFVMRFFSGDILLQCDFTTIVNLESVQ
jgi:hypothetical protein